MLLGPRNKRYYTPKLTTNVPLKLCLLQPLSQARHVRPGGAGAIHQLWAGRNPRMLVAAWHIKHYNLVNYVSGSGQLWCLLWSWIGLQRLPSGPYCCLLSWWDMNATWTHSTFTMRWHKSVMSSVSFICHKCNIFCAPILVLHEAILWHYTWRWIQRYNARARVQAPKTKHEFQISSLTTGLGWDSTMRYWGS